MSFKGSGRYRSSGQTLVLFVLGLVAIMAAVGLVVDGGNAYVQQRQSQNAVDAGAEAGATVLSTKVGTATVDSTALGSAVATAVALAIASNGLATNDVTSYYTDINGNLLTPSGSLTTDTSAAAIVGASTAVPSCQAGVSTCVTGRAAGIRTDGTKTFRTYAAGAIGIAQMSVAASATAVAGYLQSCDTNEGCALLPVTFPVDQGFCTTKQGQTGGGLQYVSPAVPWTLASPPYGPGNEAIMAACSDGSGTFGYLNFSGKSGAYDYVTSGTCNNLQDFLQSPPPCTIEFPFPNWVYYDPGTAANQIQSLLDAYWGTSSADDGSPVVQDKVVLVPIFDCIANYNQSPLPTTFAQAGQAWPAACTPPTGGAGYLYHIDHFQAFLLDHAYVNQEPGNLQPKYACTQGPGAPTSGPNGANDCLKGWYVNYIGSSFGPIGSTFPGQGPGVVTVRLIK